MNHGPGWQEDELDPLSLGQKKDVPVGYDKSDFILAETYVVYLNIKGSSASLESMPSCKALHVTFVVLSIYLYFAGELKEKPVKVTLGQS